MPGRGRKNGYTGKSAGDGGIRMRLTLPGLLFLVLAVMVGLAAVRMQAATLFLLFGAMMGAMIVAVLMPYRMIKGVRVFRDMPERAWQGQTVHLGYYLANTRRRGPCLGLSLAENAPPGIRLADGYCVHLPAMGNFRAGARFIAGGRGRVSFSHVLLRTGFPFSLTSARKTVPIEASLIIWPALGRLTGGLLHRGASETSSAGPSRIQGGLDEFFGLREYPAGDNPRWIHWRRSAGRPAPVVREMARPLPDRLLLIMDTRVSPDDAASLARRERAIRFAATLVHHAFARGYQVGLVMAGDGRPVVHRPAAGKGQRRAILDCLAEIGPNPSVPLAEVLAAMPPRLARQAQVVIVTDDASAARRDSLAAALAGCKHCAVVDGETIPRLFLDDPAAASGTPRRPGHAA